ncbi:MAG TPA: MOSC domain-containing protein [Dehalococcoidia bacterium]|nr:MOSC domain-containing protein [Dehalococcoidia bacterium]
MTARVVALYRYPVKSLTPEPRQSLSVAGGRIAGDRVLGFRFADTEEPDDEWSSKHKMLALVNTPGLARIALRFDDAALRLTLSLDGAVLADEALDDAGRRRLCEALAAYALSLPEGALDGHPERLPLRLVGDGKTPRYTDGPSGGVSLHSRASLDSLAGALSDDAVDERRFRSNIAIDGIDAWEEQAWLGREVRIGDVRFAVERGAIRCLATHANPDTGERDRPVLTTLTRAFEQEQPTFAVHMRPLAEGEIRVGDEVEVVN